MSSENRAGIAWADNPGPERFKMFPIYNPTPDRPVNVIILSDKITGVYIHYYDRRTRPCTRLEGRCHGCEIAVDRRWKAYLAAFDPIKGRLCIAELTREAVEKCPSLTTLNGRLRGLHLRLDRTGQSRNSRVQAKVYERTSTPDNMPAPFALREALERVWFEGRRGAEDKPERDQVAEEQAADRELVREAFTPKGVPLG